MFCRGHLYPRNCSRPIARTCHIEVINQRENIILLQIKNKKVYFGQAEPLILLLIRMKQEIKDINRHRNESQFGMIQRLLHIGPLNVYDHIQQKKKRTNI